MKNEKEVRNQFKFLFKEFFEGIDSTYPLRTSEFGITNLEFKFPNEDTVKIAITLERPGLLIGKGGETFDKFVRFLTKGLELNVDLKLIESKLWRYE